MVRGAVAAGRGAREVVVSRQDLRRVIAYHASRSVAPSIRASLATRVEKLARLVLQDPPVEFLSAAPAAPPDLYQSTAGYFRSFNTQVAATLTAREAAEASQ